MTFTAPLPLFFHVLVLRQRLIGSSWGRQRSECLEDRSRLTPSSLLWQRGEHVRTIATPFAHYPALCSGGIPDRCAFSVHTHSDSVIRGKDGRSVLVCYFSDVLDDLGSMLRGESSLHETKRCATAIPASADCADLLPPLLDRPTQFLASCRFAKFILSSFVSEAF